MTPLKNTIIKLKNNQELINKFKARPTTKEILTK